MVMKIESWVWSISLASQRLALLLQLQAFLDQMAPIHPLGRVGTPNEVAKLVLYLVSDDASWMTGSVVTVDGGIALV